VTEKKEEKKTFLKKIPLTAFRGLKKKGQQK